MNKLIKLWTGLIVLSIVLVSCSPSGAASPTATVINANAIFTAAARTAEAKMAKTVTAMLPTLVPPPAKTPVPQPTVVITPTAALTVTPTVKAPAPTQPSAVQAVHGDAATFVADITVPDNTNYKANQSFTKTWQLKNTGTTTWSTAYSFIFSSGSQMDAPNSVPIPSQVAPGATVNISVDMISPADIGGYTGYWMLKNSSGSVFGVGPKANQPVYVKINVVTGGNGTGDTTGSVATATEVASGTEVPLTSAQFSAISFTVDKTPVYGGCPHAFVFTAQFTLKKAATISYDFEASANVKEVNHYKDLPGPQTVDLKAGTHTIGPFSLAYPRDITGYIEFHLNSGSEQITKDITYELTCH